MSFGSPWFLLLVVPLAFAGWRLLRYRRRTGIRFSAVGRLPARTSGWRAQVAAAAPFVLLAGLACLTIAAARPRTARDADGDETRQIDRRSVETVSIMMVVDVSGSMAILDLAPEAVLAKVIQWQRTRHPLTEAEEAQLARVNRLSVVKRLFAEFVNRRPDDFIGLVTFGTYANVLTPLTRHHKLLLEALKEVEIPEDSQTAIGDGLGLAVARFKESTSKSKVIVLLSDGQQTVTSSVKPEDVAEVAARQGVKIYTIGIGTSMPVPFVAESRWAPGRKFIATTECVYDEAQLKSIAATTGGRYFSVQHREAALQEALDEIDRLEKTKLEEDPLERAAWQLWKDRYRGFLNVGVALVALSLLLSLAAARRLA